MPLLAASPDVVWQLDWIYNLRRVAAQQYIWVTHREATDSPSLSEASTTAILAGCHIGGASLARENEAGGS